MRALDLSDILFGVVTALVFAFAIALFAGPIGLKDAPWLLWKLGSIAIIVFMRSHLAGLAIPAKAFVWFSIGITITAFGAFVNGFPFNLFMSMAIGASLAVFVIIADKFAFKGSEDV